MSEDNHKGAPTTSERIAKRIARAGLCSRREAERWIEAGRVVVNGEKLSSAACVVTDSDEIMVDGKALAGKSRTRLFLYHKPAGLVTSHKDEQGRATVFDKLPGHLPRVISVGRLDLNTEGLLLLTNDGELSRYLELPATGWSRKYRVRVHGRVDEKKLAALKTGITIEGIKYKSILASLDSVQGANSWITVTLREGKNREIRRVMEHLGLQVTRLMRLSYGPFMLGKLERGAVEEVPMPVLKSQISKFFQGQK
ncbi:MAG: rRNA pseudouridine synthase [Alphaproteobacteria bacterium]|nr:rRNA pseudouridine synthase [Alphaproteobacteria bacterium]